jgi:2-hydroxy-6-oxonona-2,4-dienedioate hydrolase
VPATGTGTHDPYAGVEPLSLWALVDGLWIHYLASHKTRVEECPTVVLVHGLVVSSRYMTPALKLLARHYRVYAPDLPGFGRSEKPPAVLDVSGLSNALSAWMDTVGLERSVLVGNSMGCQIIADLAAHRPELVERAVLQGPMMDPRRRSVLRQVARFLLDVPREPPFMLAIELRDLLAAGVHRGWRTFRYALRDRIEENLPRLRTPALVVRGSRDPLCSHRWAEEVVELLPKGRLLILPGAAHAANFAAPLEFAGIVGAFIEEGA